MSDRYSLKERIGGQINMAAVFLSRAFGRIPTQARDIIRTLLYGLVAGLAAVAFQKIIHVMYEQVWPRLATLDLTTFLWASFIIIIGTSLISGLLLARVCPEAAGSGIPQLKIAFWRDFGYLPLKVVLVKFVAGALSIGGGASLGREGPTVHIAGALASNVAGATGVAKQGRRAALAAGAAAGLASAFNTPMSAITFVLEEILEDLNNARYLGKTLIAAVLAVFITHVFLGENPAFVIPDIPAFSHKLYLIIPVVSAAAAFCGVLFQKWTLDWRDHIKKTSKVPIWLRPVVGAFFTWVLGVTIFYFFGRLGVFSLGYGDLEAILHDKMFWYVALALCAAKLLATCAAYAWNGCGGIFAPTLFIGASAGFAVTGMIDHWTPMSPEEHILLAVVGMSSCLGAVVRAPITSILIVFEMTHEFTFVPVLMLGAVTSQAVSRLMLDDNFYSEILHRDGFRLEKIIPPRTLATWQKREVASIANFKPIFAFGLDLVELAKLCKDIPYNCYPLMQDGKCQGILTRHSIDEAIALQQPPKIDELFTIYPDDSIADARRKLIESLSGMLVVIDREQSKVIGVLTLHDLLRAEAKAVEMED